MGNSSSLDPSPCDFIDPIQGLLKQRGLHISSRTIRAIVRDIDKFAPWFAASGDLNLACWDKLGRDLERAKAEDKIGRGTYPLWRLVRSCLRDGQGTEFLRKGRKALAVHQDSLSEA